MRAASKGGAILACRPDVANALERRGVPLDKMESVLDVLHAVAWAEDLQKRVAAVARAVEQVRPAGPRSGAALGLAVAEARLRKLGVRQDEIRALVGAAREHVTGAKDAALKRPRRARRKIAR